MRKGHSRALLVWVESSGFYHVSKARETLGYQAAHLANSAYPAKELSPFILNLLTLEKRDQSKTLEGGQTVALAASLLSKGGTSNQSGLRIQAR